MASTCPAGNTEQTDKYLKLGDHYLMRIRRIVAAALSNPFRQECCDATYARERFAIPAVCRPLYRGLRQSAHPRPGAAGSVPIELQAIWLDCLKRLRPVPRGGVTCEKQNTQAENVPY